MIRLIAMMLLVAGPAMAEAPVIEDVVARQTGETWSFDVTVRHPDTGWDHYADGWEVLDAAGNRLGFRELLHPHENEQPFTRSLSGVAIPTGTVEVFLRARCSVDGWSDAQVTVPLP